MTDVYKYKKYGSPLDVKGTGEESLLNGILMQEERKSLRDQKVELKAKPGMLVESSSVLNWGAGLE